MIARYLEVPRQSKFSIIEEEFSTVFDELTVARKRAINKRINAWVRDVDTIKLLAIVNPWGCRQGGGGRHSKFEKNTQLAAYKICYENGLNGVLMGNVDIMQLLTIMAEIHNKKSKPAATKTDASNFRQQYQVDATRKGKTFYDPAAVLEGQIPSLITIGVAQTLLPITYVLCCFVWLCEACLDLFRGICAVSGWVRALWSLFVCLGLFYL